jgi:hypothetical protein
MDTERIYDHGDERKGRCHLGASNEPIGAEPSQEQAFLATV